MINDFFISLYKTLARIIFPGILFVLLLASACNNDPEQIKALTNKDNLQLDKAQDVTIIYSRRGHTSARLFAHEFIRNEAAKHPYVDMEKGLKAEFFDDSMRVESTLTARYARYYDKEGYVLIRDSVVVVNKKGEQLKTQELVWNQKIHKFYTEKPVQITTSSQMIYGDGLEANEDFTWYEIKNPRGSVLVNKNQLPE